MDPFAMALGVLHRAAGSVAAVYTAPGAADLPLRVIWAQGSAIDGDRLARRVVDGNELVIQRSDVAMPVKGAIVTIGDVRLRLNGAPMLDDEGLSWTCGAEPTS